MANIRIDLEATLINGQALTFKSPADCSQVTGLIIYYPEGDTTTSNVFKFVDAHGVDVGSGTISLFAENVLVKVILDTDSGKAYVQNADTNAYLEGKLAEKYSPENKPSASDISDFPTAMAPTAHNQAASTITAGTFGGQVVANASGQAVGTSLLRNSKLVSADTNPTVNGEICWTYK
jgi:hypothetical protein